ILAMVGVVFLGGFILSGLIIVENRKAAILIRKTGQDLPDGAVLAMAEQKGIQQELLPEGWYWRNPYTWATMEVDQVEIPPGKIGIQVRTFGADLHEGAVIAESGERGILQDVLGPGRYMINKYAYRVILAEAVTIPSGYVGVVTRVSGKEPKNPNEFLVEAGERGIQKIAKGPGTYNVNPYIEKITPIDTRSHRFDMTGDKIIRFPSLDGFDITMEGTIEWYIDPDRVEIGR